MAVEDRHAAPPLIGALRADPTAFDFYGALRRLECVFSGLPRIGHAQRTSDEPVRFGQAASLAFAPSTLANPVGPVAPESERTRLFVYFLGLLGPNGPLPLHMTEYVRDRELNQGDAALARFLDIFHHRAISLFYRAWASAQQAVTHQRSGTSGRGLIGSDRFAFYAASLLGLVTEGLADRDSVPDAAKLHYAGHLACHSRHPEGLECILSEFFGVKATILPFMGQWIELEQGRRLRMGESRLTGTLGSTAVVGGSVWDRQQKFRLRLGPMGFDDFTSLLPGRPGLKMLVDWVRTYTGDELSFDVQLVLRAPEVPRVQLGRLGQLGWSTWVCSGSPAGDADDLTLRPAV